MKEVDLSRVPTGEIGWATLLAYAKEADDRVERYFLEVKSGVDLNTKKDRAKVAKFILGAANRDPEKAARRFGGYAVMLLGVGGGAAPGIPGFEAMDLSRDVQKFMGVDGPNWDFDRIPGDGGQDVIAIVVAPPTGEVWTCRADGDGLNDGDIYVRADGETRKAKGDEVRAMVERATTSAAPSINVEVDMVGEVAVAHIDQAVLVDAIESAGQALIDQAIPRRGSEPYGGTAASIIAAASYTYDRRSKEEFKAEVEAWLAKARKFPEAGVLKALGRAREGVQVRVRNRSRTFLRDVRIDIEIDGTIATPWRELHPETPIDPIPGGRPEDWGKKSLVSAIMPRPSGPIYPRSRHGIVEIKQHSPTRLTLAMDSLRPEEEFTSDADDVVLVIFNDSSLSEPISGRWRLTADGVHDVHEGEFGLASTYLDLRDMVTKILA